MVPSVFGIPYDFRGYAHFYSGMCHNLYCADCISPLLSDGLDLIFLCFDDRKGGGTPWVNSKYAGNNELRRTKIMQAMAILLGVCAAAMLLWYVYILMKGDDQL